MEAMMAVDCSQGDKKEDCEMKENVEESPLLGESMSPNCKQSPSKEVGQALAPSNDNSINQDGSESDNGTDGKRKKKRRRRQKGGKNHRKWKPYSKMSWTERHELEEKETLRANQKREEAFASGHPVAPYNTTQFLMEDHAVSPDLHNSRHNSKDSVGSVGKSSDESDESNEGDDDFMAKEFSETYNNLHAERLQTISKEELIKDYVDMESKLERLQKRLESRSSERSSKDSSDSPSLSSGAEDIETSEIQRLRRENRRLTSENIQLKSELKDELCKINNLNDS